MQSNSMRIIQSNVNSIAYPFPESSRVLSCLLSKEQAMTPCEESQRDPPSVTVHVKSYQVRDIASRTMNTVMISPLICLEVQHALTPKRCVSICCSHQHFLIQAILLRWEPAPKAGCCKLNSVIIPTTLTNRSRSSTNCSRSPWPRHTRFDVDAAFFVASAFRPVWPGRCDLSFICIPQSTRALDQGGVEPRQAVSPKASVG